MFENLKALPPDAILKLINEHRDDPRDNKIDLGVGVYRDEEGRTPILDTVKKAERWLVAGQSTKAYLGSGGDPRFNAAMQDMIFGAESSANNRLATLQTPGGSGSLRVAAGLILRARPAASVWASDPTWANHVPLLGGAGISLQAYPYYDTERSSICFEKMLETLASAPRGDIVLLHGCCHNPTGMDLVREQWQELADVMAERDLLPFIDIAYQGFAESLDVDAFAPRHFVERFPEMLVSASCSKNFGLYRERVGTLSILADSAATVSRVHSQAMNIVRTMYSMPPDHGAAIVGRILGDTELRKEWQAEVEGMRSRLKGMRSLLSGALREQAPGRDFSHLERANGMFSFLGVSAAQVARLKKDFGVYMVDSSRINVAGITRDNVEYLAEAVAAVL
ncbi:MAG: amino acid aminotransferase [Woeseia sp.]